MKPVTDSQVRIASGIICLRRSDSKILLLRHSDGDHWGVPKGHMDETDASIVACALRETQEEIGVSDVSLVADFRHEVTYTRPGSDRFPAYPKRVVYFLGYIEDNCEIKLSAEHQSYEFIGREKITDYVQFENLRTALNAALDFAAK